MFYLFYSEAKIRFVNTSEMATLLQCFNLRAIYAIRKAYQLDSASSKKEDICRHGPHVIS